MPRTSTFFPALFCGEACDRRELGELKRLGTALHFSRGQTIFSEGEPAVNAFGLSDGVVRLYKLLPDGRRHVVAFALPGDFLALSLADYFSFSADAVGEVSVCRFPREELKRLVQSSPNIVRLLMEFAMRELQTAQDQLTLLASSSAEERMTAFLLNWRSRLSFATPSPRTVSLPMRRQDIADFLGLTLETVSRTLAKLEEKGAIRIVPNGVVLTGLEHAVPVTGRSCGVRP
jgi:CRP/FNR family transcriptional regulator, anaerobic regulatory protein